MRRIWVRPIQAPGDYRSGCHETGQGHKKARGIRGRCINILCLARGIKLLNTVSTSGRRLAEAQARAEQEEARASKLLKALVEKGDLTEEARQEAQEEIAAEGKGGDAVLLQHLIQKGVVSEESISEVENPTSGPTE